MDGTVGGAEEEEGAGRVVRRHGGQLLGLPVLGQAVPDPDTTCGKCFNLQTYQGLLLGLPVLGQDVPDTDTTCGKGF